MADLTSVLARIRTADAQHVIPIELPQRQPHLGDLTLDDVRREPTLLIPSEDVDLYFDGSLSETLEQAVRRAYATEVRQRDSTGQRVLEALADANARFGNFATWCPACHPGLTLHEAVRDARDVQPSLTCELSLENGLRAACARGCGPDRIARAIEALVATIEHHERAEAQNEASSALAAQLRYTTRLGNAPQQEWIVPGLVPKDGLTLLGGTSGDGKTWTAMHIAICVAMGVPWFKAQPTRARTLLILLEGALADQRRRIELLATGLRIPVADLDGHLDIYPTRDFRADDPASMLRLEEIITTLGHKLVVIDNLTNARANSDENSAANLGAALKPLAALAARGHGILLLHHMNAKHELRGSSAIRQHADMVFEMRRASSANDSLITLARTKDRSGTSLNRIRYRFFDTQENRKHVGVVPALCSIMMHGAETFPDDENDAASEPEPLKPSPLVSAREAALLACLPRTSEDIYRALGGSRNKTYAIRRHLEQMGLIVCKDSVWSRVDVKATP